MNNTLWAKVQGANRDAEGGQMKESLYVYKKLHAQIKIPFGW